MPEKGAPATPKAGREIALIVPRENGQRAEKDRRTGGLESHPPRDKERQNRRLKCGGGGSRERTCLWPKFPVTRENTANFLDFRLFERRGRELSV